MSSLSLPTPVPPALTRRHHAWLSLGLALFVIYGSLVPFHYTPLPWGETLARFREVCSAPVRVGSRSDWLANLVLTVPLGYLLMGALCADRPRKDVLAVLAVLAVLPSCLCLSIFVEFTQLWFPPRVASLNDIVAQSIGAVLGVVIWLVAGQRMTEWFRGVWGAVGRGTLAARLLPGYLALLALLNGMPFDLTLSPADLYHKYREGRVLLVPFAGQGKDIYQTIESQCWNVALFLPVGLLLANLPGAGCRSRRDWRRVLVLAITANLLIQGLKLFVVSRFVNATSVVTGSLAILAGWGLALLLRGQTTPSPQGQHAEKPASRGPAKSLIGLLLLLWLAAAVFMNWHPFNFQLDAGWAAERLQALSLVPFVDYYQGNYWNSFDQGVHKVLLFLPLGVLLALALPAAWGSRVGVVVLLAAAVAAILEGGQLFLPTRYASITDILVESSGAWIGVLISRHARSLLGGDAAGPGTGPAQSHSRNRSSRNLILERETWTRTA